MSSKAVLHRPGSRWRDRLLVLAASSALAAGGLTALAVPAEAEGVCAAPVVADGLHHLGPEAGQAERGDLRL
ncbi:hypothetical protein ACWDA9_26270, partial [Streptomyces sp. NPDC001193]